MALEMQVHKDIAAYEAKPMWGLTWRRIAAVAFMVIVGGGFFALVTIAIVSANGGWMNTEAISTATNIAMYLMFLVIVPAAVWAWYRPLGLPPEVYAQYVLRHKLTQRVTTYADTYADSGSEREPLPSSAGPDEPPQQPTRRDRDARRREIEKRLERTLSEREEG